jgi:hypothetical protein
VVRQNGAMDEAPATPQPRRRRWRRWTVRGLFLIVCCAAWLAFYDGETIRKSYRLRIGMTIPEVDSVMGRPAVQHGSTGPSTRKYATAKEQAAISLKTELWGIGQHSPFGNPFRSPRWPLTVRFDGNGRADLIMRGYQVEQ